MNAKPILLVQLKQFTLGDNHFGNHVKRLCIIDLTHNILSARLLNKQKAIQLFYRYDISYLLSFKDVNECAFVISTLTTQLQNVIPRAMNSNDIFIGSTWYIPQLHNYATSHNMTTIGFHSFIVIGKRLLQIQDHNQHEKSKYHKCVQCIMLTSKNILDTVISSQKNQTTNMEYDINGYIIECNGDFLQKYATFISNTHATFDKLFPQTCQGRQPRLGDFIETTQAPSPIPNGHVMNGILCGILANMNQTFTIDINIRHITLKTTMKNDNIISYTNDSNGLNDQSSKSMFSDESKLHTVMQLKLR